MSTSTGSRRAFGYTDDEGNEWAVQLDESTYETLTLGFDQQPTASALGQRRFLKVSSKFPLVPRYMQLVQQDGATPGRKIRVFVGKNDAAVWIGNTIVVIAGVTYQITAKIGEQRFYIPTLDTGLDDGDSDIPPPA